MQHEALMGTAGKANMRKPGVRTHAPLCGPPRVRGMPGMATSSPQMPSPPRPKLGHSKTFPCCSKYTVCLLQCIANNNFMNSTAGILGTSWYKTSKGFFCTKYRTRGDSEVKLLPFVQPCSSVGSLEQNINDAKGSKISRAIIIMSYAYLCHWGYVWQLYIKTNGLIGTNMLPEVALGPT